MSEPSVTAYRVVSWLRAYELLHVAIGYMRPLLLLLLLLEKLMRDAAALRAAAHHSQ